MADYGRRLGAGAIDYLIPGLVAEVFRLANAPLGALVGLLALAFQIYSKVLEGQTGQSIGKQVVGARTVMEATGQPPGVGVAIGRWLLHIIDTLACCVGYIFPAFDAKRQTFADKIVKTVVIIA